MAYEQTLLDALERIKSLEQRVTALEAVTRQEPASAEKSVAPSKQQVINLIAENLDPDYVVDSPRNTSLPGIRIAGRHHAKQFALMASKDYRRPTQTNRLFWTTWMNHDADFSGYDGIIFATAATATKVDLVILDKLTMQQLIGQKKPDARGKIFFYIRYFKTGTVQDVRDRLAFDLTGCLNNWKALY